MSGVRRRWLLPGVCRGVGGWCGDEVWGWDARMWGGMEWMDVTVCAL